MKTYEAPSINIPSRGQRFVLARRNCPEVFRPNSAAPTSITPTTSWALGTRQNIVTAAQFGNNPLILIGFGVAVQDGIQLTGTGTTYLREEGQIRIYIDKNLGVGDQLIAEIPFATSGFIQLVVGTDSIVYAYNHRRIAVTHYLLPAYTLIRGDAAIRTVVAAAIVQAIPYFYTPSAYNLFEVPLPEFNNQLGQDRTEDFILKTRCFPSLGSANVTTIGAWVELEASLDADYLIEGWCYGSIGTGALATYVEIDFAACPANSLPSPDNIQARGIWRRAGVIVKASGHEEFFHPFIAYKGERLMSTQVARTGSMDAQVILYGRRI